MSRIGWADLGLTTMNEMTDNAAMISSLNPSVPLIADIDTGYGGPLMINRTVKRLIWAGVAAFHIEDQPLNKRCGHLLGKETVTREEWYTRLRAAVNARQETSQDIFIIARTDARQKHGVEEVVERLKMAVEIGVDAVFPEALQSKEEARQVCEAMGSVPVLLNMVQNGVTPEISTDEATELGFKIVIYPSASLRGAISGMKETLYQLKSKGVQEKVDDSSPKDAFLLCGLAECMRIDQEAGGSKLDNM